MSSSKVIGELIIYGVCDGAPDADKELDTVADVEMEPLLEDVCERDELLVDEPCADRDDDGDVNAQLLALDDRVSSGDAEAQPLALTDAL